jgi:HD-GYP domain-containing protein (c-di-GMP phosphodiesterase class II)
MLFEPGVAERLEDAGMQKGANGRSMRESVRSLAAAVDALTPSTTGHSVDVARLARRLAHALRMDEAGADRTYLGALVHDVGKVGEHIGGTSTGQGTTDHDAHVHALLGERIVSAASLPDIARIVRHSHERWDGAGGPDGLAGAEIPLEARVVTLCDAFVTECGAAQGEAAAEALDALAATQGRFDPELVAALRGLLVREQSPDDPHSTAEILGDWAEASA